MCVTTGSEQVEWSPLPGGWSGESFLSRVGGRAQVVRIYDPARAHRPDAAQVDATLHRWVRGLVPVPEVVEVRPSRDGSPSLLVTEFVAGDRGDDLVRTALEEGDATTLRSVGEQLGRVAAALASVPTLAAGRFTDPDLVVVPDPVGDDLFEVAERAIPLLRDWDDSLRDSLAGVVVRAQARLDKVGRTCLVHGDLGPRNAVFGADRALAAVVDWEHAHSGHPFSDLGTLLRFDRHPAWDEAVLAGWTAVRGDDAEEARDLARCADLAPLLRTAIRPGGNLVVDLADVFLAEVAARGDWHAVPEPGAPRVLAQPRLDA